MFRYTSDLRGAASAKAFDAARRNVVFAEDATAIDDAPARGLEGGIDVFGAGFGFVHVDRGSYGIALFS